MIGQIASAVLAFIFHLKLNTAIENKVKYGIIYTTVIMVLGLLLIECLAHPLVKIFGLSILTQQLCISAMRIISLSFVFAGLNITFQGLFQALNAGIESLVISIYRQLVFVLPVAWGFSIPAMKLL